MSDSRTFGQRCADAVTTFSGSWSFILWFAALTAGWIVVNAIWPSWDPYPFLFLNWTLTVVSTLQNPLILLSQNRQNEMEQDRQLEIVNRLAKLQLTIDDLRKQLRDK